ncbi:hypothetical protein D1Z90_02760 [Motilimonas pumila]|uniref:Uncharacterized protein n=1 Tax=Motilimonas pumila TaxID=2303987 RepID=A0A418YIF4_9GAMM|nr:hypothetical protein D1Z90_02760 [Motilimonas pumila]
MLDKAATLEHRPRQSLGSRWVMLVSDIAPILSRSFCSFLLRYIYQPRGHRYGVKFVAQIIVNEV